MLALIYETKTIIGIGAHCCHYCVQTDIGKIPTQFKQKNAEIQTKFRPRPGPSMPQPPNLTSLRNFNILAQALVWRTHPDIIAHATYNSSALNLK